MISDCDGHHYPWYGSRNETVIFEGPCKMYQSATISMNDNFHPHVTWRNPANRNQSTPNLSHIIRDQSFYVWLVAWNMTDHKAYILKTVRWNMFLEIEVDPTKSLGQRARLISNPMPKQPDVLENTIPIPRCALMPPNANSAQMLVWRPKQGKAAIIIQSVWKKDKTIQEQVPRFDEKLCHLWAWWSLCSRVPNLHSKLARHSLKSACQIYIYFDTFIFEYIILYRYICSNFRNV